MYPERLLTETGTTTVTADAYGTLKTPKGIYQNALRIYMHQIYQDVMTVGGTNQTIHYETKVYTWYQTGIHDMLLSLSAIAVNGGAPTVTLQYSDTEPTTAINDLSKVKSDMEVFPNPASQHATIKLTHVGNAIQNISMVNVLGQKVADYSAKTLKQSQNGMYSINLEAVPSGLYWLQVQTKQGQFSQKLQVIR